MHHILSRGLAASSALAITMLAAGCSGSNSIAPVAPASASLASATNTLCVDPSSGPQNVALPNTGGVTATLQFAQYDAGGSGCANVTIATGTAAATAAATANSAARRPESSSSANPLISITFGQAFANNSTLLGTTVLSGATVAVSPNVVFPDGTYDATVTLMVGGTSLVLSLQLTATNGQLTVTSGPLPLTLGNGAVLNIYNRGVVPPGFDLAQPAPTPTATPSGGPTASGSPNASASPTAAPSPTAMPTATSSPVPTATPTPAPGQPVADGTVIGNFTTIVSGLPQNVYGNGNQFSGNIIYSSTNQPGTICQSSQTQMFPCTSTGSSFQAGVVSFGASNGLVPGSTTSYSVGGLGAKSYRVDGCTGNIGFGGNGVSGTITYPDVSLTSADTCIIDIFSEPANVVNADPNHGFQYSIFEVLGPVAQTPNNYVYPPAVNAP